MKYMCCLISLYIISQSLIAQTLPKDSLTNKFLYNGVVLLDSMSQRDLFIRATKWFEGKYKTQSIDLKNEADGIISHKGSFKTTFTATGIAEETTILYTITISVKYGKYKYEITDFSLLANRQKSTQTITFESYDEFAVKGMNKKIKSEIFDKTATEIKKIIEEIKSAMLGLIKGNDW